MLRPRSCGRDASKKLWTRRGCTLRTLPQQPVPPRSSVGRSSSMARRQPASRRSKRQWRPGATLFLSQLGQACAMTGDRERARHILEQLRDRATHEFVSPYHFAYLYSGLGNADAALDYLERAFERRSGGIYGIKGSFLFNNLRTHPRFESLVERMNLG